MGGEVKDDYSEMMFSSNAQLINSILGSNWEEFE